MDRMMSAALRMLLLGAVMAAVQGEMMNSMSSEELRSGMSDSSRGRQTLRKGLMPSPGRTRSVDSPERYPSPGGKSLSWRFDLHHTLESGFVQPPQPFGPSAPQLNEYEAQLEQMTSSEGKGGDNDLGEHALPRRSHATQLAPPHHGRQPSATSPAVRSSPSASLRQKSLEDEISSLPVFV